MSLKYFDLYLRNYGGMVQERVHQTFDPKLFWDIFMSQFLVAKGGNKIEQKKLVHQKKHRTTKMTQFMYNIKRRPGIQNVFPVGYFKQ